MKREGRSCREMFQELLELARIVHGWSWRRLARALDYDPGNLRRVGEKPRLTMIRRLADLLGWPVEFVVDYCTGSRWLTDADADDLDDDVPALLKKAKESGNFSQNGLAYYKKLLEQGFVLSTLQAFRHAPGFLANRRIYDVYPSIICGVLGRIYKSDDKPRRKPLSLIRAEMKGKISLWSLAKDAWRGGRALLWWQ